jgi:hypothetical protein
MKKKSILLWLPELNVVLCWQVTPAKRERRRQKVIEIDGIDHRKPGHLDGYQGQRLAPTIFIFLPGEH